MRVQEEIIEKIRKSLDIVDVIGEYVQLKKQGRSYIGLCPFHNEHTPSFSVSADKQLYHCFGCGAGGNIFTFVMESEGFSFPEAVEFLAGKANIDLGETFQHDGQQNRAKDSHKKQLLQGMELLTKFYHYLLTNPNYGSPGMKYLRERGFTDDSIEQFQIGYAVDSWETATRLLERRHANLELMEKAGLLSKRSFDNKFFDRFRHRIIFPICNARGQTVALAGRILKDEKPKYLNTPESEIFHKGNLLYGYHLARQTIKKTNQVILLEGYVDVIKAHQAGVTNAVASMGTSLTEAQAALLSRIADVIVICYDSDDAGIEASFRAADMLKQSGAVLKIAKMPKGLDPDDYIKKFGGERFVHDVIGASQTLMAFKMDYLRRGRNLNDEGDRLRYIEEVVGEISGLDKAVERDHYLRLLSEEFSISLDALKQQQFQMYKIAKRQEKQTTRSNVFPMALKTRLYPAYEMAERRLLAHMMRSREITEQVQEAIGGSFNIDLHQALAAHLYAFYSEGNVPDEGLFIQSLKDTELQERAAELALMPVNAKAEEREIEDYIEQVIRHSKASMIEEKERERKQAEQSSNVELAARLLSEIISIKKQLKRR